MKYRIVKFYSQPYGAYRFKIQKKILWWWVNQAFEKRNIASYMDFSTVEQAEAYLSKWLLSKEKPFTVKYFQINEE